MPPPTPQHSAAGGDAGFWRGASDGTVARRVTLIASVALSLFALLFIIWNGSGALFTIVAGVVLGGLFDSVSHGMGRIWNGKRLWRLLLTIVLFVVLLGGFLYFGATLVIDQLSEFTTGSQGVFASLNAQLQASPLGVVLPDGYSARELLSGFLGGASGDDNPLRGATMLFGAVTTAALIFFLGCFFAFDPAVYRAGALSLLPPKNRERVGETLIEMGDTLRRWLLGQLISMAVVGGFTALLLMLVGMPFWLVLGVQAGLLAFIPTLGPLIAAVPILIAGSTVGGDMVLYGLGVYVLVQFLESNLIMPLVQKRAVELPPAFTLGSQLLLGALFGFAGLALAVPLMAMLMVAVRGLYVDDELGSRADGHEGEDEPDAPDDGRAEPAGA